MFCPVDTSIEMVAISVEGIVIHHGRKCNGHWARHGELAKLAARDAGAEPIVTVTHENANPRHCPEDQTPLVEVEFTEQAKLLVDVCPKCQGIWLDANELSQALTVLGRLPHESTSTPTRPVLDMLARWTRRAHKP